MYVIEEAATGADVNSFPTLRAVAYFCYGMDEYDLRQFHFRLGDKWISWAVVLREINRIPYAIPCQKNWLPE